MPRRFALWIALLTLIFCGVLWLDLYPGLRGNGDWRWTYALPDSWTGTLVLVTILLIYLGGLPILRRGSSALWLAWVVLIGAGIGYAVVGVRGDAAELLFIRTVSPVQTGASTVAVSAFADDGLFATLERWPDFMREAGAENLIHFTTSPPGQALAHFFVAEVGESLPLSAEISTALRPYQCANYSVMVYTRGELFSAGVWGLLMPLWAALMALPLFSAAHRLTGDRIRARWIAAWSPLLPTVALFLPVWNTLYPALIAWSFALFLGGITRKNALYMLGAGMVFSITTLLNFVVLPALGIFALFGAGMLWAQDQRRFWREALRLGGVFALGLSLAWLWLYGVASITPFDLWRVSQAEHRALVQRADDLAWWILHPYDLFLFMGWPVAALFLWRVGDSLRGWSRTRRLSAVGGLALATAAVILVVDLLGMVQGENGRILSFYAPFLLLTLPMEDDFKRLRGLIGGQALLLGVMAVSLATVPLDLNPPPDAPRTDIARLEWLPLLAVDETLTSAAYRGEVRFEGYRFIADVGSQAITLETVWRGIERTERPYLLEVVAHAENAIDGEIITAPQRWQPQNGNYLSTCWRAGDEVADVHVLSLPAVSAPVQWTLDLRWVDEHTGDVMGETIQLGPIAYP